MTKTKTKTLRIELTRDHAIDGQPGIGPACPLALAFIAAGFRDVAVCDDGIWFRPYRGHRARLMLGHTRGSRRFVRLVDSGVNPVPHAPKVFQFPMAPEIRKAMNLPKNARTYRAGKAVSL